MPSEISIIIPALNEAESIGHVVASMPWRLIAECIVVDNGSTDATASIATQAGARVVTSPRGYGAACLAGSNAALPSSSILVYMDGDGSDVIADLSRLVTPIQNDEADFVIGSRLRGTREPGSMLGSQVFAAHLISVLLRLLGKGRYTDMGPFRAIRRTSLQQLKMSELTYGWNLEMQIKAVRHRIRILEIPVDYRKRIGGTSKVSGDLKASIKAGTRILKVLFRAFRPRSTADQTDSRGERQRRNGDQRDKTG
jgi:glycosyltransferase involved in cell wall biosynthesis